MCRTDPRLIFSQRSDLGFLSSPLPKPNDFAKELGRPVGIVLTSGVRGEEAARLTAAARPL
jgi:hypothetical protein